VINKYKMAKHFKLEITEKNFVLRLMKRRSMKRRRWMEFM